MLMHLGYGCGDHRIRSELEACCALLLAVEMVDINRALILSWPSRDCSDHTVN